MKRFENTDAAIAAEVLAATESTIIPNGEPSSPPIPSPIVRKKSMKRLTAEGSIWTIIGYGASQVIRFAANVVLTWMLVPEVFGKMALINVVLQGLQMFSDIGIAPAIMSHKRGDDPDFYNTAWTMQIFRGTLLWATGCVVAVPFARLYDEAEFAVLIPVMGLTAIFAGFNSTKLFAENRRMQLGRLTCIDLASQLVGIGVMVLLVIYWQRSVWPLVYGGLVGTGMKMVLTHLALPGPTNRFHWSRTAYHELYRFGRWIFISSVFTFLAMQTDRLLLGHLLPLNQLGVYSIALGMVAMVTGLFEQFTNRILMPAMAHWMRLSKQQFREAVLQSRQFILSVALVAVANLVLLAPLFFQTLYAPQFHDAGWITRFLGFGLWFTLLQRTSQASLLAAGHSRALALANAINFLITLIAAPLGFYIWGLRGFITGWTLGNLAAAIVVDHELEKDGIPLRVQDIVLTLILMAFCVVGIGLSRLGRGFVSNELLWLTQLLPALVLSGIAALVILFRLRNTLELTATSAWRGGPDGRAPSFDKATASIQLHDAITCRNGD